MQRIRVYFRMLGLLCCLALTHTCIALSAEKVVSSVSPLGLDVPTVAVRGEAVLATGNSRIAVDVFLFHWLGKKYPAKAIQLADGSWQASILLPVPLQHKKKQEQLALTTVPAGHQGQGLLRVDRLVHVKDKQRPVKSLKVDRKYVEPPAAVQERIKNDREKVRQALASITAGRQWTLPLARPVPGAVSSQFGLQRVFNGKPRGLHRGLDLRGAEGTPVQACADGQAVLCDNLYFAGNSVYLSHGEGVFTAYIHLSEIVVTPGQQVRRGQVIGRVGATGRVTGPHLHLSLFVQGHTVDPLPLLSERYIHTSDEALGHTARVVPNGVKP